MDLSIVGSTLYVSLAGAWLLAVEEKADVKKCVIAALMHDVSHFVSEYSEHGVKSAEIAKEFLLKENLPKDFVEDVAYAIKSHVGELNPKTQEAKVWIFQNFTIRKNS